MKKTPIYTIGLLIGIGFIFGLLFADVTHDLQVSKDEESVKLATGYYHVMIVKSKEQGPILLVIVGIIALCSFNQIFTTRNKGLLVLFILNLGALLYLFVDVTQAEVSLTSDKAAQVRPLLQRIRDDHLMMVGLCVGLMLVVGMIARSNKAEQEAHVHGPGSSHGHAGEKTSSASVRPKAN